MREGHSKREEISVEKWTEEKRGRYRKRVVERESGGKGKERESNRESTRVVTIGSTKLDHNSF